MTYVYVLAGLVLINSGYYLLFIRYLSSKRPTSGEGTSFPVSIIVCAKNEAENLRKHIPKWLQQDHGHFELVLIDDASADDTEKVIEQFAQQDPRIVPVSITNNEAFWSNKKYSLTLGIKKARHQRLLFTDADCFPASPHWLSKMTAPLSQSVGLVLGYGAYTRQPGLLNTLIRFETLITATQYFSYAYAGTPYMGVGRNLAYTSKLFFDNSGFMSHMNLRSGDDDLFVNQVADRTNTALQDDPETFTYSIPKTSWKDWFNQKRRHITTASRYKAQHRHALGFYYLGNFGFWLVALLALSLGSWPHALALIAIRLLLYYWVVGRAAKRFDEGGIWPLAPLLELLLVSSQLVIYLTNRISKPKTWK